MGRGLGPKERLRRQIRQRHSQATPTTPKPTFPTANKTLAMRLLEREFGQPIQQLITGPSLQRIAQHLGIHESTVIKWRKRLGIDGATEPREVPTMETHLP